MADIQYIDDERSAAALADRLNGNSRRLPIAVVTVPASRSEPWIDVAELAREAGDLAEVYVMPTGTVTWEFSHCMPEGTQVYGGAGRVYPVGHEWTSDTARSPLRFAFDAADGQQATQELVSDVLRMAAAAGLLQSPPARKRRRVEGIVKQLVATRALVVIGSPMPAVIAEELTAENVPIARIFVEGQRIEGWYDSETRRVDVRASVRPPGDALTAYSVGDVVLAKVAEVRQGKAVLALYPRTSTPAVTVQVAREDITTNPLDDLRTLMTVGEVVTARVVATGPRWGLRLNDVEDDEPVVEAPALLAGGPPWLIEEPADEVESEDTQPEEDPLPTPDALPMPSVTPEQPTTALPVRPVPPAPPTPRLLDRNRSTREQPPPPDSRQTGSTKALLLKIDGLAAEVNRLLREREDLSAQLLDRSDERTQHRHRLAQAERRAARAERDLKTTRKLLRRAGNAHSPRFADREQGFRYLVLTQWATRTLPSEQADRPLPDYLIGPRFLDSLDKLEGITTEKVADVVFEIVTDLARQNQAREVHPLRAGPGGEDPVRVRDDGAIAFRVSLQVKTPSARRIHYWLLPSGQIELGRVTTHDDFDA